MDPGPVRHPAQPALDLDAEDAILETLAPAERAVFVLREFLDLRDDDIASALDRRPAVVRQIAFRAREHVATLSR